MSNLILPIVRRSLETSFIKWEKLGEALSLAFVMKKPCVFFGRGGHGKSEMIRAVLSALANSEDEIFIQSFGEGMSEARLYGGLSLKALNCPDNPRMVYEPENSFLAHKYALLEELFDAPPVVLLALKDTLTDRRLNNGSQQFPMQTSLLVAATNKRPEEISELGDSAHALTERFPIQLCVEWDSYESKDFEELFDRVTPQKGYPIIPATSIKGMLSHLIAEAHESGEWISPRQAVVCLDVCVAAAQLRGGKEVTEEDLMAISFVPGTAGVIEGMAEKVAHLKAIAEATNWLEVIAQETDSLEVKLQGANSPIPCLKAVKSLQEMEAELQKLRVPDGLTKKRNQVGEKISKLISSGKEKALSTTH